jgi:large subunit ribosomal protein L21
MYAVVRISGFQSLVKEGDVVTVPRQQAEPGASVQVEVLFVKSDEKTLVGTPLVTGANVEAEVVNHFRADKVMTFKFIRRENYRRKKGHRQDLTKVKIGRISLGS